MSHFIAPDYNPLIGLISDITSSTFLKFAFNIEKTIISRADRQMLRSYKNERLLHFSS